jgi:hypothetical protein
MYKPTISLGQGLLLLMDHYRNDAIKITQLKKLYLSGVETQAAANEVIALLHDPLLSSYTISYDAKMINNDPTRRYFETHLAYESLTAGLSKIKYNDLKNHVENLYGLLPPDKQAGVAHILEGRFKPEDSNLFKEYADYINKIKSMELFSHLSDIEALKIELLVKSTFLAVVNAWYVPMPLPIYGIGIFAEQNRGKVMPADQATTRNHHLGLMKGHMPLALDDIARSDKEIPYLKPSDQAAFVENTYWVHYNFSKVVHPFSNSISGTMLCQLRALAKLRDEGMGVFMDSAEHMAQFCQLSISAMLFNSGGHSLHEFITPLAIDAVRYEFRTIPGFDGINLESMYLTGNEIAFNAALEDTIHYNKAILMGQSLHAQLKGDMLKNVTLKYPCQTLGDQLVNLKDGYEKHSKNQFFNSIRVGSKKNILIQNKLEEAISQLEKRDINNVHNIIINLKKELETLHGAKNIWGKKSESFKLVESIEAELLKVKRITVNFKEKLKAGKESGLTDEVSEGNFINP